jgi:hypothetical protein
VLLDGFSFTIASLIFGIVAVIGQGPALNINLSSRLSVGVIRNTHQLIRIDVSFRSRLCKVSPSKLSRIIPLR